MHATDNATAVTAHVGERWAIESGSHKVYACSQHGHSAVEAILGLLDREPLPTQDIIAIDAFTHPLTLGLDNLAPPTSLGAKFSMPNMIAAPLVYGAAGAEAFSHTLHDPRVSRLRALVSLHPYEGNLPPPYARRT